MAQAQITLRKDDKFRTKIQSRHHVYYADEPEDAGGDDTAATPMEMAMGSLGACIAITVKLYADRKGWPLEGIDVSLDSQRFNAKDYDAYEGDAQFIHEIRKGIKFHGDLSEDQLERLYDIAGKCPVHRLIANPVFFVEKALEEES